MADVKQVFDLSATFLPCSFIHVRTKGGFRSEPQDCTTRSDGEALRRTSNEGVTQRPPSREVEADSHVWDKETTDTSADAVLGGKQTYSPPSEAPSTPSANTLATLNDAEEDTGQISVDS